MQVSHKFENTCIVSITCKALNYYYHNIQLYLIPLQTFWSSYMYVQVTYMSSSETQGLLGGTMRYFRTSDIFRQKFTSKADKPLATYSYQTSSRSVRKIFFRSISETEFWFGKNKWRGLSALEVNFRPKVSHRPDYQPLCL